MKKTFLFLFAIITLMSCDMTIVRDKDLPALKQEASEGNIRAMSALVGRGSYSGLPEDTLKAYENRLLEMGDLQTLDRQINGLHPDWHSGEEREKEEKELIRWLTFGAEHGCSEYMVKLGEYYRQPAHADQELATYWYQRAADSLNYDARMAFIYWGNREKLLDRASKGFSEKWNVETRDYSLIGKLSTSLVSFALGFPVGTLSVLFQAKTWWQGLIGLAILVFGLWFLYFVCKTSRNYAEEIGFISCLPILFTGFYGMINGTASWVEHGYSIGRLVRHAGMYSTMSDLCVYGSWIWIIGFLSTLAYGIYKINDNGENVVPYILIMVGGSFVCYIASMMLAILFILLLAAAGALLLFAASNYKPNNYRIKGAGTWGGDLKASKRSDGTFEDENGNRWEEHADGSVSKREEF